MLGRRDTNWHLQGHLTFPYCEDAWRRTAYTAPVVFYALALDRLDRVLAAEHLCQCPLFIRMSGAIP